jgi:formylglycine-generating enzyme required for sulfatase activity
VEAAIQSLATGEVRADRDWYVTPEKLTFIIVRRPVEFRVRSGGRWRSLRITHSFAIAAKEVTVEDFLKCDEKHRVDGTIAWRQGCPVNQVSWYAAAGYCNWLSEQRRIPPDQRCYQKNAAHHYGEGMGLRSNYLQLTGYRLPTEEESLYAAGAGAETAWPCGDGEPELLARYVWFYPNSYVKAEARSHPVGTLKPNDLGLFDMLGNVSEWCQEERSEPRRGLPDATGLVRITDLPSRMVRGGSFAQPYFLINSANSSGQAASRGDKHSGFRPARTIR